MPVRIRLARPPHRTKLTTHYHIVAIDGRKRRDAKPIEVLGVYDPVLRLPDEATKPWTIEDALPGRKKVELKPQKKIEWSVERLKYWLSVGAQPSKTVETLLEKGGLIPVKPKPQRAPTLQPSSLARLAAEQLPSFQSAAQQKTVSVTGS